VVSQVVLVNDVQIGLENMETLEELVLRIHFVVLSNPFCEEKFILRVSEYLGSKSGSNCTDNGQQSKQETHLEGLNSKKEWIRK